MVRDIKCASELWQLITSGRKVVVHFLKPHAEPCQRFTPKFDAFSKDHEEIEFVAVDIELLPDVARGVEIEAIPTVKGFHGGAMDDLEYLVERFD
ncbi:Cytoplasmic thioredoxin isoenzyme 2 [Linnemannia gamsii]|uniref:Cytoplasmic thioredoxin isoenzyme 2 n=1 Tax=Linnemannia gamsii TaxID=64522 RepID=A0ABQ7JQC1_9FUNG|nr:Cytoplasmic thioredoxin isoenzyme 2 [Linnemannia gamsii]